ncbi:dihydrolipoyllysine-residue acetyltransferase [Pleionea litopenaei]|uniref:Acetyltransferase component of pyruvate dehydrogenase complex n=1 Tax=Pleionea litopenaei TaxID=3070815 RepID=A0AA51RVZ2_9GAMM|nr:dihydrolipoyllysine-residue acetyltransferase [Pleionea sp. HL-JVS1]WMS88653.1 dihydrolipoyllysine-residue acetyltransferase [Pleionea sp. HL-JVS1]
MANLVEVKVPDIGDSADVDVIEVLVSVGDQIAKDDPLITLETDKATMEVPSSEAGIVKEIKLSVGDKVSQGDIILTVEAVQNNQTDIEQKDNSAESNANHASEEDHSETSNNSSAGSETVDVTVPDIGDSSDVDVIEVCVNVGDEVSENDSLIVLETDKATMEVPSPYSGVIESLTIKVGDKVSQGSAIGQMTVANQSSNGKSQATAAPAVADNTPSSSPSQTESEPRKAPVPDYPQQAPKRSEGAVIHASPAVRRFARELGVDLAKVSGSGPKSRVLKEDVQKYVKYELSRPKATAASGSFAMPEMPEIDFSKWGEIEQQPLSRIQKISSVNLHRNWITIPHVTQHEDADITELEAFRKQMKDEAMQAGVRLTPLAFVMKALVHTLQAFPRFNASLANDGENLIVKKYYHIGVAADTPDGLVVPVVRDVDQKSVYQIATELGELSAKARDKKLGADAMQGSTFTISSLGGIGGTSFTPIVAWPNVAILGLSKNQMKPVWNGESFEPRLMLPMSLSYDHRVIDGADAARFCVHLANTLADIRRVLL